MLEMVDREGGDDRVEWPLGQCLAQVSEHPDSVWQAHGCLLQHRLGTIKQHHLCLRMATEHRFAHQPRACTQVQDLPHLSPTKSQELHSGAVETIEARHYRPALRVVVRSVGGEGVYRIRHPY